MPRIPSIPTIPTSGAEDIAAAVPASVMFMQDTFTGSNGTAINSRSGELNSTWTKHAQSSAVTQDQIQANRSMGPAVNSTNIYTASANPLSPNYEVVIVLAVLVNNATSQASAAGRMDTVANTAYYAQYSMATNALRLNIISAGVATQLGSDVVVTPTTSFGVRMVGDQISALMDGAVVIGPITDTTITVAGKPGFRHGGVNSVTDGVHIDSITATTR